MALKKLTHLIFAEGESTGHKHVAEGGVLYEDTAIHDVDGPRRLFETTASVPLTHEEHGEIVIPPSPTGRYRIGGVIEYDPFKEEAKRIED